MIRNCQIISKYKWLLVAWFFINLIQAYFTNLHYDEAYYWLYSKILDWGYFDHPPLIALISKIGVSISHSTLGLRIIPVLMGVIVLLGILKLAEDKTNEMNLFFYIISFPLITSHIAGFLTLPDASLCFFFILFLFFYKKYLQEDSANNVLILSLVIAAMIYSKYHAFLIIAFTILANTKLLLKRSFWLIAFCSFFLLIPHFIWQFQNDFPSLLYHLNTRTSGFSLSNFTDYIFSQLLLAGPLSGLIIIFLAIKFNPKNIFERTLKYIALGFYLFFLIYCFRSRIEAHWTAVATIPLIIISYKQLTHTIKIKKLMPYLIYPSVILILCARFILIGDNFEDKLSLKSNFRNMEKWANEVDSISNGSPVLFTSKYQDLSVYSFAKNKWIPGAPKFRTRYSQIDLYKLDSIYEGKKVFALSYGNDIKWESKNRKKNYGSFIEDYYSYTGVEIDDISLRYEDTTLFLSFELFNNTKKQRLFVKDTRQKLKLYYNIDNVKYYDYLNELTKEKYIMPFERIKFNLPIKNINSDKVQLEMMLLSNNLRVYSVRRKKYKVE